MQANYLKLYKDLSADLQNIQQADSTEIEKMESCFTVAFEHWERLQEKIKDSDFDSEEEEIHFFKYVKPQFTGLIEYYTQRCQALLFLPVNDAEAIRYFWKMEEKKMDRFFTSQKEFIHYWQSGEVELDEIYFLRQYSDRSNFQWARVYDLEHKTSTSHDWLVSKVVAFELYRKYVKEQLEKLS